MILCTNYMGWRQSDCNGLRLGPALGAANGRHRYWSGYKGGVMDWAASYPWYVDAGARYTYKPPPGLSDDEVRLG
jgi:hypothetical protein